jgi:hypothetical protein
MLLIVGLAMLSISSYVKTTIELSALWIISWLTISAIVLWIIFSPFVFGKVIFPFEGGAFKKIGACLTAAMGLSLLTAFAVLSGVPVLLHHLSAEKGDLVVTVEKKDDHYDSDGCYPKLFIREFTWFGNNFICPDQDVYEQISLGSKIVLVGNVSAYGVESSKMIWVKPKGE